MIRFKQLFTKSLSALDTNLPSVVLLGSAHALLVERVLAVKTTDHRASAFEASGTLEEREFVSLLRSGILTRDWDFLLFGQEALVLHDFGHELIENAEENGKSQKELLLVEVLLQQMLKAILYLFLLQSPKKHLDVSVLLTSFSVVFLLLFSLPLALIFLLLRKIQAPQFLVRPLHVDRLEESVHFLQDALHLLQRVGFFQRLKECLLLDLL